VVVEERERAAAGGSHAVAAADLDPGVARVGVVKARREGGGGEVQGREVGLRRRRI
jgi:hypothetical protein